MLPHLSIFELKLERIHARNSIQICARGLDLLSANHDCGLSNSANQQLFRKIMAWDWVLGSGSVARETRDVIQLKSTTQALPSDSLLVPLTRNVNMPSPNGSPYLAMHDVGLVLPFGGVAPSPTSL